MATQLNHTIVWSSNQSASAKFLAELLGRPAPTRFGHFDVVELDNSVSLDFADAEGPIRPQHYAFLISEADFDAVFGRIKDRGLDYWADPRGSRPGEINHNDGPFSRFRRPLSRSDHPALRRRRRRLSVAPNPTTTLRPIPTHN